MLPWLIVSWPFRSLPCVILFSFTSSHPISVSLTVDFLVSPFLVLSDLKLSYPGLSYQILSYFLLPWLVSFTQNVSPTVHCIGMPPEQPIQSQSVKNRGAEVFRFLFGGEEWIFVHGCTWRWKGFRWRVTKHLPDGTRPKTVLQDPTIAPTTSLTVSQQPKMHPQHKDEIVAPKNSTIRSKTAPSTSLTEPKTAPNDRTVPSSTSLSATKRVLKAAPTQHSTQDPGVAPSICLLRSKNP